jgi:hypothetical protein
MSSHCIFDTLLTEIQLQIIYLCTQLVIKLDNDRKKDATSSDRNAVSEVDHLPPLMKYAEIFLQKPRDIVYCNKITSLNGIKLYNHSIYSSFGQSKISPDKEATRMTMRMFLVLIYIVLIECHFPRTILNTLQSCIARNLSHIRTKGGLEIPHFKPPRTRIYRSERRTVRCDEHRYTEQQFEFHHSESMV